jgi:hypothetical protein
MRHPSLSSGSTRLSAYAQVMMHQEVDDHILPFADQLAHLIPDERRATGRLTSGPDMLVDVSMHPKRSVQT